MKSGVFISLSILLCAALAGCGGGGGSSSPLVIPVDPPPPSAVNQPPTITSVSPTSPVSVRSGEQRTITVAATDPDNDPLTFQWQTNGGTVQPQAQRYRAVFTAPSSSNPTTCTVRVDISDGRGHTTSASVIFNVAGAEAPANEPPEITAVTANPASVTVGQTASLTVDAGDPEGDQLAYTWFCDAGSIQSQDGAAATWKAPDKTGVYSINVSVSDGNNPSVLGHVNVTVTSGSGGNDGGSSKPVVNGLTATYVKNDGKLAYPVLSKGTVAKVRIDPNINFDWSQKSPIPELVSNPETGDANDFGIRWTGYVLGSAAGTYVFRAKYDDGMRVWITNDQNRQVLVIDGWTTGPRPLLEGSIALEGSKWYPIIVEYFESKANSYVSLSWVPPGGQEQIIPSNRLRTE